jgi:hypothetical protein
MTLAFNLRNMLDKDGHLQMQITRDDVAKQDMSFMDKKLKRLKKMLKGHLGRNTDWDPELRTKQLAQVDDVTVDPNTSRQVRRQVERLMKKFAKTHKFGKKMVLDYNHRVHRNEDPKTGMITHRIVPINRITLTQVNTSRYVPHQGKNIRYSSNGQRAAV